MPTTKEQTRFDARLPKEQKMLFERAASIGGYRNLTDFVLYTVQEKAEEIIREKDEILASERDAALFFDAVTNPRKPSGNLKNAYRDYQKFINKSR